MNSNPTSQTSGEPDRPLKEDHGDESAVPLVASHAAFRQALSAEPITAFGLAGAVLNQWRLIVTLPLVATFLAVIITLLLPHLYTSSASFVPESPSGGRGNVPGNLMALATQFGLGVAGDVNSPALYANVLQSRTLRDSVLQATFSDPRTPDPTDSITLIDILEVRANDYAERLEKGRRLLASRMSVNVDNAAGVVRVSLRTRYPTISADAVNKAVALLNRFNLETRQSMGQERRRFVEERLTEAELVFAEAEGGLQQFLESNRLFQRSPQLQFEHDRIQRQVRFAEEVVATLLREREQARIEEVNDTPQITIIDQAIPAQEKSSPRRRLTVTIAFVFGGMLAVVGAFLREYGARARERKAEQYIRLVTDWAKFKSEVSLALSRRRP